MKLTVCELSDNLDDFQKDWKALAEHVRQQRSDLVLLPEIPACPWFATKAKFDLMVWRRVIWQNRQFLNRLGDLAPAFVLATLPVEQGSLRLNQAFVWGQTLGYQPVHAKTYFPDEPGFFETKWFHPTPRDFTPYQLGETKIGFLICTELMFNEWARHYGRQGVHLVAVPRATEKTSVERWLIALRMAAIVSGAFVISSNHVGVGPSGVNFGGAGAIISPEGEVLGVTSSEQPFITIEVNLEEAEAAKKRYPRYVRE
ncbi:carbon-nitrogen hydrolase family protein [candidate division KSB1 bacterium]|nr:carbon-nitrogen hydrolase family protein [candidate division KSB1 bacterium]